MHYEAKVLEFPKQKSFMGAGEGGGDEHFLEQYNINVINHSSEVGVQVSSN